LMVTSLICRATLRCASRKSTQPLASIPQFPRTWGQHASGSSNLWCQHRPASTSHRTNFIPRLVDDAVDVSEVQVLLDSLKVATSRCDISQVWTLYESLTAKGLVHTIGPVDLSRINKLIDKELEKGSSKLGLDKLETLAIVCAVNGRIDALRRVMVGYLKTGDAPSAVKAFGRFKNMSSGNMNSDSLPLDESELVDESQGINGADLLALVISAYAYCGAFGDALHTVLHSAPLRISASRIINIAEELELSSDVRERALNYTSALEIASLVTRPESFRSHIRNLTEPRSDRVLEKICLQLAAGFDGEFAWATADESNVSRSRPVFVQDTIWAILIRALVICRNDNLAGRLWSKMTSLHVAPTASVWHALLDGYRETGQFERLLSAWNSMIQSGIKPDAALHCSRILALFDSGRKTQAMSALEEFKRDMKEIPSGAIVVFNAAIRGLLKAQDIDGALSLLKDMSADGLKPDIVSYNTFIQYYARKGDMQSILSSIRELSEAGIPPDVVTFTTIHVALLKAGQAKATESLLEVMKQMGIEPNVATYSAMIDQYVKDGTSEGIRLGRELLEKMEKMAGARPNEITYTSFLMGLHRNAKLSQEEVADTTQEILQRMERRGIRVKLGTYHILLKGALTSSRPDDGLAAFQNYYRMMVRKNIKCAHDTWYIILSGLIRRNEWGMAKVMVDEMLRAGFQPMWGVQDMVRTILQHQSSTSSRRSANKRPFV